MSKLLNTTFLVTMSFATPEGVGYGSLYASSSKIYFTSSLGNFDLTDAKGYILIREYVSNTIWSPPANVKYVRLLAVGGGGGGGGGSKRLSSLSANSPGGGGGSGGIMVNYMYPASAFTRPEYNVTIGGGGNSGSGNTNAAGGSGTNGVNGGITGLTSGSIVMIRAAGGILGQGGVNNGASIPGGVSVIGSTFPSSLPYARFSVNGGYVQSYVGFNANLSSTIELVSTHALNGLRGTAGAGGGGGFTTSTTLTRGGSGSGVFVNNTVLNASAPGATGTGNAGTDGVNDVLDIMTLFFTSGSSNITSSYGFGSGGGGGAGGNLSGTIGGGKGGNGGTIGAGGGGGGACNTGSLAAGNGGRGGDGYLAIIEYY